MTPGSLFYFLAHSLVELDLAPPACHYSFMNPNYPSHKQPTSLDDYDNARGALDNPPFSGNPLPRFDAGQAQRGPVPRQGPPPAPPNPIQSYYERALKAIMAATNEFADLRARLEPILAPISPQANSIGGGPAQVEPNPPSAICGNFYELELRTMSLIRAVQEVQGQLTL